MTALHLQRLSWLILERLKLCLCEVLRWLNRQHWTDVQTDVHIVPVDSNAQSHNLLKMPTASGALVLVWGNELSPPAPFSPEHHVLTTRNWSVVVRFDYVWVDHIIDHFSAYIYQKRGFYYCSGRVPKQLQQCHSKQRIGLALNTQSRA